MGGGGGWSRSSYYGSLGRILLYTTLDKPRRSPGVGRSGKRKNEEIRVRVLLGLTFLTKLKSVRGTVGSSRVDVLVVPDLLRLPVSRH